MELKNKIDAFLQEKQISYKEICEANKKSTEANIAHQIRKKADYIDTYAVYQAYITDKQPEKSILTIDRKLQLNVAYINQKLNRLGIYLYLDKKETGIHKKVLKKLIRTRHKENHFADFLLHQISSSSNAVCESIFNDALTMLIPDKETRTFWISKTLKD